MLFWKNAWQHSDNVSHNLLILPANSILRSWCAIKTTALFYARQDVKQASVLYFWYNRNVEISTNELCGWMRQSFKSVSSWLRGEHKTHPGGQKDSGWSRFISFNPLLQERPALRLNQVAQGIVQVSPEYLRRWTSPTSLDSLFQCLVTRQEISLFPPSGQRRPWLLALLFHHWAPPRGARTWEKWVKLVVKERK